MFNQFGQAQDNVNVLTPPVSNGIYPVLNMSHMQLFHHFSNVTSGTLIFGPQLWKEKALPSAFKVKLAYYIPPPPSYQPDNATA